MGIVPHRDTGTFVKEGIDGPTDGCKVASCLLLLITQDTHTMIFIN